MNALKWVLFMWCLFFVSLYGYVGLTGDTLDFWGYAQICRFDRCNF